LWQGHPIAPQNDHVNGDRAPDSRENRRYLCPNCHAAAETWCCGNRRAELSTIG
ncbi:MAG: endonuclease, partial [Streptomyces oryziradicis]|nr:endonuclease [Actinacidiphila oryziradicis]